jgi:hypothetical protein
MYYAPMLRCWQLIRILAKTNHSCLRVGHHRDPLSSMLFLLAIEPLHMLFKAAQAIGVLDKLSHDCEMFRVSLYVDDAALFINPSAKDFQATIQILKIFVEASGLSTNMVKTRFFPIRSEGVNLDFLVEAGKYVSSFPCLYLGLPLNTRKPSRVSFQPLVQRIGDKLPRWQGR